MSISDVLFNPNGRIGQQNFWIGVIILVGANLFLAWIPIIGWLIWLGLYYVGICVYGKRLHDIGKSVWIHILVLIATFMLTVVLLFMVGGSILAMALNSDGQPDFAAIMSLMGSIFSVFVFPTLIWIGYTIWLGLAKGDAGANAYGAPEVTAAPGAVSTPPSSTPPAQPTVSPPQTPPPGDAPPPTS